MSGASRVSVVLPDFDLAGVRHFVSSWHARIGQPVVPGDRLVEITAGDVTVDLPAPARGIVAEQCASVDDPVEPGQILGWIEIHESL